MLRSSLLMILFELKIAINSTKGKVYHIPCKRNVVNNVKFLCKLDLNYEIRHVNFFPKTIKYYQYCLVVGVINKRARI